MSFQTPLQRHLDDIPGLAEIARASTLRSLDKSLVTGDRGEVELEASIGSEEGFQAGLEGGVEVGGKVGSRVRSSLRWVGSLVGVPLLLVLVEPCKSRRQRRSASNAESPTESSKGAYRG